LGKRSFFFAYFLFLGHTFWYNVVNNFGCELNMSHFFNFLKGIIVGIALVLGMSGGTMAIILGIYDKIINAVGKFFKNIRENLLFLLFMGLGAGAGILLFSNIVTFALEHARHATIFLFLGIIAGGFPPLLDKAGIRVSGEEDGGIKAKDVALFLLGAAIVMAMSSSKTAVIDLASSEGIVNMVFMLFAGFVSAIALVLPGISGSFFLLTIGLYDITMEAINELNFSYLIPFAAGIALGTILTVKAVENLLRKYPRGTYSIILGFVIGSMIQIFMENIPSGWEILFSVLAAAAGVLITLGVQRLCRKLNIEE
jgi:putative membrane protein